MICTFGDVADVTWWRELNLPVRAVIQPDGTLREVAWGAPGWESVDADRASTRYRELVGLSAKLDALPSELSGGEAQRVAIARALAQSPQLLLCDEPTGHLDSDTAERVLDLIEALQREFSFALVTATHDAGVAARAERVVELIDGRVVGVPSQ